MFEFILRIINDFSVLQLVFLFMAFPSTLILSIQMVFLFLGLNSDGAFDTDIEVDTNIDVDGDILDDSGIKIFTTRSIFTFFTVTGWIGLTLTTFDVHPISSIIISVICGSIAVVLMALLVKSMLKLESSGTINYKNLIGKTGEVYISIPPNNEGKGKVMVIAGEKLTEFYAITNENEKIPYKSSVKIIDVKNGALVVEKN